MKMNVNPISSKKDWIAPETIEIHINGNGGGGPDFASELTVGS
ncbi:hypothetical protein [Niabella hibiscisoli]|nr:hypothetical protein [Niabella hibiscisoli]